MKIRIPPPVYMLMFGALMWLVAGSPYALIVDIPFRKPLAILFAAAAVVIVVIAIWQFRVSSTTIDPLNPDKSSALVTNGIYHYTRNPMYVSMLLILCAWALKLSSVSNVVLLAGFVATLTLAQIRREEDALKSLFPDEFEDYRRKVRRWI